MATGGVDMTKKGFVSQTPWGPQGLRHRRHHPRSWHVGAQPMGRAESGGCIVYRRTISISHSAPRQADSHPTVQGFPSLPMDCYLWFPYRMEHVHETWWLHIKHQTGWSAKDYPKDLPFLSSYTFYKTWTYYIYRGKNLPTPYLLTMLMMWFI